MPKQGSGKQEKREKSGVKPVKMKRTKGRSQSCDAVLSINGGDYNGKTGKGHGHAEMDALHNYIVSNPGDRQTWQENYKFCAQVLQSDTQKTVSCPSRDVCKKCSYVLKKLKFVLAAQSHWGDKNMGSTEWGVSSHVRAVLALCDIDYDDVKSQ